MNKKFIHPEISILIFSEPDDVLTTSTPSLARETMNKLTGNDSAISLDGKYTIEQSQIQIIEF